MQSTNKPTRGPAGVTILAVLALISGILGLLGSLSILSGSAIIGARGTGLPVQVPAFGLVLLALSAVQIVFGYGAWVLKPWAWTLGVALQVAALAFAIIYLAIGAKVYTQAGGIILAVVPLALLLTPGVRRAFGKTR